MASHNRPPEQRNHNRYQLKDTFYVIIQGDACGAPARVADLSKSGVGFYSVGERKKLTDKFILLDLVTDNDQILLRSLSARVVFGKEGPENGDDPVEAQNRYGLQFINLSALQKKQLGLITKKYAWSKEDNNLPCQSAGITPMVPWQG
ncbi:MAG TPA: PilZ domain-containing protein [Desulfobulbaceae bacterium]|nr:PilZ domain-containing protein [Desulfobulbaceae bacterium]